MSCMDHQLSLGDTAHDSCNSAAVSVCVDNTVPVHSDVRFQRAKRHNRRIAIAQTTPFCTLVLHSTLCPFPILEPLASWRKYCPGAWGVHACVGQMRRGRGGGGTRNVGGGMAGRLAGRCGWWG